ncbi:helix-turn-helix domain-containing protein [Leuconostoc citreum]|uniref:helix-turn-helix domain-containing protein n=1 Tax=Leuconostoc citreum TaxID=33964 RepID=UPI00288C2995|nr:helix-turn-helix transcriptional regulator [Leuconostoc citreum]
MITFMNWTMRYVNWSLVMNRLRELRHEHNELQIDLAVGVGMDKQEISRYELGITVPSLKRLIIFADYYNVSIDYLVGRSDER